MADRLFRLAAMACLSFSAVPAAAISLSAVPMRYAGVQEAWWAGDQYWDRRREAKLKEIAKGPKKYDFVFIGGTLVQNWEGWSEPADTEKTARLYAGGKLACPDGAGRAVWKELCGTYRLFNVAMAGDTTSHALWRLQNGELEGYTAKGVVFMPDFSNDNPPEEVAEGVKGVLDRIAEYQSQAIVLLMPVLPRGNGPSDPMRKRDAAINALVKRFADGKKIVWLDISNRFTDPDGSCRADLMPDGKSLSGKGYGVWRDALLPYFKAVCGR